jgi:hypothetical protein
MVNIGALAIPKVYAMIHGSLPDAKGPGKRIEKCLADLDAQR